MGAHTTCSSSSSSSSSASSTGLNFRSGNSSGVDHNSSSSYVFLVQHLIEKCLILKMDRAQCVHALSTQAHIDPLITTTVWNELVKENKGFFDSYFAEVRDRGNGGSGQQQLALHLDDINSDAFLSPGTQD